MLNYNYAAYFVAIKNDFCLEESIRSLQDQGVKRIVVLNPITYWSDGKKQDPNDFNELYAIAKRTGVELRPRHLAPALAAGPVNQAIYTEALYRNCALEELFTDPAIHYALTVDADELWLPGTLKHIDSLAVPGNAKISLPCVPTIGVPGYPIDGALDQVLVATSREVRFTWGRSTTEAADIKGTQRLLHFTATRKTLEEVITKHRQSAHYPDPTYDFEGWIQNVLPTVGPGSKDVHMYRSPHNIWPLVRNWTPEELSSIPSTLHPWLAPSRTT